MVHYGNSMNAFIFHPSGGFMDRSHSACNNTIWTDPTFLIESGRLRERERERERDREITERERDRERLL